MPKPRQDYRPKRRGATLDLGELVNEMRVELACLLGMEIEMEIGRLPAGGAAPVRAAHGDLVTLLRHLALDARTSMPAGGRVTFSTGELVECPGCSVLVIHEMPHPSEVLFAMAPGRNLSLAASYRSIEREGGHFHAFCRGSETMLTICLPRA